MDIHGALHGGEPDAAAQVGFVANLLPPVVAVYTPAHNSTRATPSACALALHQGGAGFTPKFPETSTKAPELYPRANYMGKQQKRRARIGCAEHGCARITFRERCDTHGGKTQNPAATLTPAQQPAPARTRRRWTAVASLARR